MSFGRIAAVTGANKGLGLAIVRSIALQYPKSPISSGPLLIYLTARDKTRGEQAVADILGDAQLREAKALRRDGGLTEIRFRQLDVSDERSIGDFGDFVKKEHADGIDILVNNAGIALDGFAQASIARRDFLLTIGKDSSKVKDTLKCNYYGTLSMIQTLLPQMRQGGRIVNMASLVGILNKYSPSLTDAFRSAAATDTPDATSDLMAQFQASVDAGTHDKDGWPSSAYAVSKSGVIALTMALNGAAAQRKVLLNCCCPGYVKTDMTKNRGRRTVEDGAATPVKLAVGDIGATSGEFWSNEEVISW